ncbi:MAG: hypothetical protein RBR21_06490 [Bacteroidales bacterium]|nr:hypothetical protein [Bacteroidales bacterium]
MNAGKIYVVEVSVLDSGYQIVVSTKNLIFSFLKNKMKHFSSFQDLNAWLKKDIPVLLIISGKVVYHSIYDSGDDAESWMNDFPPDDYYIETIRDESSSANIVSVINKQDVNNIIALFEGKRIIDTYLGSSLIIFGANHNLFKADTEIQTNCYWYHGSQEGVNVLEYYDNTSEDIKPDVVSVSNGELPNCELIVIGAFDCFIKKHRFTHYNNIELFLDLYPVDTDTYRFLRIDGLIVSIGLLFFAISSITGNELNKQTRIKYSVVSSYSGQEKKIMQHRSNVMMLTDIISSTSINGNLYYYKVLNDILLKSVPGILITNISLNPLSNGETITDSFNDFYIHGESTDFKTIKEFYNTLSDLYWIRTMNLNDVSHDRISGKYQYTIIIEVNQDENN